MIIPETYMRNYAYAYAALAAYRGISGAPILGSGPLRVFMLDTNFGHRQSPPRGVSRPPQIYC